MKKAVTFDEVRDFYEKLDNDFKKSGHSEACVPLTDVKFYTKEIMSDFGLSEKMARKLAEEMAK